MRTLVFCVIALAMTASAFAQDPLAPLKPADRTRIQNIAASREKALGEAAAGNAAELRTAKELLALPAQPLDPSTFEGKWRCRAIQLGGTFPLTMNPFYECRIARERGVLFLEKLTGGTRRKSRLAPLDERRLLLYGSTRAASEAPRPYGADDYRDEVGILERVGPARLRAELPEPRAYNSAHHEIIELVRPR